MPDCLDCHRHRKKTVAMTPRAVQPADLRAVVQTGVGLVRWTCPECDSWKIRDIGQFSDLSDARNYLRGGAASEEDVLAATKAIGGCVGGLVRWCIVGACAVCLLAVPFVIIPSFAGVVYLLLPDHHWRTAAAFSLAVVVLGSHAAATYATGRRFLEEDGLGCWRLLHWLTWLLLGFGLWVAPLKWIARQPASVDLPGWALDADATTVRKQLDQRIAQVARPQPDEYAVCGAVSEREADAIQIAASGFQLPGKSWQAVSPPRPRAVRLGQGATVWVGRAKVTPAQCGGLRVGDRVVAVGRYGGAGQPLVARTVLAPTSDLARSAGLRDCPWGEARHHRGAPAAPDRRAGDEGGTKGTQSPANRTAPAK